MVATNETLKMYEVLSKHFNSREDARTLIEGVEGIIDEKFLLARDVFTTEEDLAKEIGRLESRMEQSFKDQLKWIIMLMFGFSSLIIALLKLT